MRKDILEICLSKVLARTEYMRLGMIARTKYTLFGLLIRAERAFQILENLTSVFILSTPDNAHTVRMCTLDK